MKKRRNNDGRRNRGLGLDTRELELFVVLAETLHFGQTGERMHLSASAISRTIKRMEDEVGRRLLERDKRSVRLTSAGAALLQYAQQQLAQWRGFVDSLQPRYQQLHGEISLYCSVTAAYSLLARLLSTFRSRYPAIELKLHTGDQADSIDRALSGEEDLAIAALPEKVSKKLRVQTLAQSPLVFIAPAFNCAVREQVMVEEPLWEQIPLIMSERGLARLRVDAWYRSQNLKPNVYAQVSGHEAIVSMVGLGLGVGVVPELVLANSPQRNNIAIIDVQPALAPFVVGLCATVQRLENPLVKAFWDSARASSSAEF
ncbi:MAG TPA: HTH-type transcriptional activator IlvY [Spongiibacteraceae bacterium]|nr:HTH-type transcriptional activator IlvY [Spongiibacteraceae bacterium]